MSNVTDVERFFEFFDQAFELQKEITEANDGLNRLPLTDVPRAELQSIGLRKQHDMLTSLARLEFIGREVEVTQLTPGVLWRADGNSNSHPVRTVKGSIFGLWLLNTEHPDIAQRRHLTIDPNNFFIHRVPVHSNVVQKRAPIGQEPSLKRSVDIRFIG